MQRMWVITGWMMTLHKKRKRNELTGRKETAINGMYEETAVRDA